ncbi:hypothetical protein AKJ16_DCAP22133 [Drosera capensis]
MNEKKKQQERFARSPRRMSFLAGRLTAKEGAYFLDQSKQAITCLAPRATATTPPPATTTSPPSADVLPEVLRHSLPPSILRGGGDHEAARSSITDGSCHRQEAENTSKRWRVEVDHDVKEKPILKELSKNLGARS